MSNILPAKMKLAHRATADHERGSHDTKKNYNGREIEKITEKRRNKTKF